MYTTSQKQIFTYLPLFFVGLMVSLASAQTRTVIYDLVDTFLVADITDPFDTHLVPVYGQFQWTYDVGDFSNGTGEMISLDIPEWNTDALPVLLQANIDLNSIEYVLPGNWDYYAFDLTIQLNEPLSPDRPSTIDTNNSLFNINIYFSGGEGHVVQGSIIPDDLVCTPDLNTDGVLDFFDVAAFLDAFAAGDPAADFNMDGLIDFFDASAFLDAFATGCP